MMTDKITIWLMDRLAIDSSSGNPITPTRMPATTNKAEARALEGVAQAQPKKKKSAGAKRSRVTKSAQGIKVSMPKKKKK